MPDITSTGAPLSRSALEAEAERQSIEIYRLAGVVRGLQSEKVVMQAEIARLTTALNRSQARVIQLQNTISNLEQSLLDAEALMEWGGVEL